MLQSSRAGSGHQDRAKEDGNGRVPFAPSVDDNSSPKQLRKPPVREVASRYKVAARAASATPDGKASLRVSGSYTSSPAANRRRASVVGDNSKIEKATLRSSGKNLEQAENKEPRENVLEKPNTISAEGASKSVNLSSTKEKYTSRPQTPSSSRHLIAAVRNVNFNSKYMSQSLNGSFGYCRRWSEQVGKKSPHKEITVSPGNDSDDGFQHQQERSAPTKTVLRCESFPGPKSPFRIPSPGKLPSSSVKALSSPPNSRPSSSHGCRQSPVKRTAVEQEEAQLLRVLHNRYLQWRFVNARAKAAMHFQDAAAKRLLFNAWTRIFELRTVVAMRQMKLDKARKSFKLASVLASQEKGLEEWCRLENVFTTTFNEMVQALTADVLRVPLCRGAKANALVLHEVLQHARTVLNSIHAAISHLLPKAQEQSFLAKAVADIVRLERALVGQLEQLLKKLASLEIEERSFRAHCIQVQVACRKS